VRLSRSSLCSILLERGEEDLAVLIARADLPEILDSGRDAPALAALGLGDEELRADGSERAESRGGRLARPRPVFGTG
jgi:hypothetical protein